MSYIEAFVLPVTAAGLEDYKAAALASAAIWKRHGALSVVEAVGDGLTPGTLTSFPRSVMAREDEVVVWSFITFRDKAHRDAAMDAAMKDPAFAAIMENVPVDGKRMIWGSFLPFLGG